MRSGRAVIHECAGCAPEVASSVEASCQFFITVDLFLSESEETNAAVLFLPNLNLFLLHKAINDAAIRLMVKEIVQFFIVDFEKGALDYDIRDALSLFNFLENEFDNPWDDTKISFTKSNSVATSHCVSFAGASLTISKNSGVKALETSQDQILHTDFEHILLSTTDIKGFIESECAVFADYELVFWLIAFHTNRGGLEQLPPYKRSHSHCNSD